MIGKAVFWIGLLVLLTPHEPDLGLGRPSAFSLQSSVPKKRYVAPQQIESLALNIPRALLSLRQEFLRRAPQIRADIRYSLSRHKAEAVEASRLPSRPSEASDTQF